jgi:hypothetical protein
MEEIIKGIEEIISSAKRDDGYNYYNLINRNEVALMDESGSINLLFLERIEGEAYYEMYAGLADKIKQYTIDSMVAQSSYNMLCNDGLMLLYKSGANDLFYIQISDNHIHIHLHYSGQY